MIFFSQLNLVCLKYKKESVQDKEIIIIKIKTNKMVKILINNNKYKIIIIWLLVQSEI